MSDDRNRPRSTTSAQQQKAQRASARRQEAEHELASRRKAEKKLARREASEHRKAQRTSAKRRQAQQEAAEHRRSERELAARRQVEHVAAHQQQVEQEAAARRQAEHEEAQREAAARREAQREAAERRRADREAAEHREAERSEAEREQAAHRKVPRDLPERRGVPQRRSTDQSTTQESPAKQKGPGLLLLLAGLAAGALVAIVISARKTAQEAPKVSERELVLRDEEAWTYETKLVVYAPAGAIAGHVHDVGGFPGLVGPLDGPPMDRVDWTEPHGARLRFQVHARSGGGPSDTTVQIARGSRTGPLNDLESEVRDALAALRSKLERS